MKIYNIIKASLLVVFGICASANALAQWTDHYSFSEPTLVAETQNKTVCGSSVGLFALDHNSRSLEKITKTNLLSSYGATALCSDGKNTIYVGYSNGDIDIVNLETYEKTNIPELKRSENVEQKQINGFCLNGNVLYCATKSGILEVDLAKEEIKSYYKLRSTTVDVGAIAICGERIYAATNVGLLVANATSRMLEDPKEWQLLSDETVFCDVSVVSTTPVAVEGSKGAECKLYTVQADTLALQKTVAGFKKLDSRSDRLMVTSANKVEVFDDKFASQKSITKFTLYKEEGENEVRNVQANAAAFGSGNSIVIAENSVGLLVVDPEIGSTYYLPNGPLNNKVYCIKAVGSGVYVSGGGVVPAYDRLGVPFVVHCLSDNKWTSITSSGHYDALEIASDPNNPDSIYVSLWGNGLFSIKDHKLGTLYNSKNSPIRDIFSGYSYHRVGAITFDHHSNLIVTNAFTIPGLKIKTSDNEWHTLSYKPTDDLHSTRRAMITSNDNIWLSIPQNDYQGLIVFNMNNTPNDDSDDIYRAAINVDEDPRFAGTIKLIDEEGEEVTKLVYDIEEDNNGQIWLGTAEGILTFNDDRTIFDNYQNPVFHRIRVPRNDGSNLADYLLEGVRVNDIAVDGANRKWIATSTDGVYLVSDDGCETIKKFSVDNSPLPTNEIVAVDIIQTTGEVFFGTPYGVLSYRSDATKPEEKLVSVRIYPNPVRPDFAESTVYINDLVDQTQVKITDIAGRLVYHCKSLGGLATWNCTNLDGNRVDTGVYIVWTLSPDGLESAAGKITVIK